MAGIFISYRRSDSQDVTGRIYDRLVRKFNPDVVFKDVDSIPIGVTFPIHLKTVLSSTNMVLVIIGPNWASATNSKGERRLDDPADFVRVEIEIALRAKIPVVPVLVSNAHMPAAAELPPSIRGLVSRNGVLVRPDPDFHTDMDRLLSGMMKVDKRLTAHLIKTVVPVSEEAADIGVELVEADSRTESRPKRRRRPKHDERHSRDEESDSDDEVTASHSWLDQLSYAVRCVFAGYISGSVAFALVHFFSLLVRHETIPENLAVMLLLPMFGGFLGWFFALPCMLFSRPGPHPLVLAAIFGCLLGIPVALYAIVSRAPVYEIFGALFFPTLYGLMTAAIIRLLDRGWFVYLIVVAGCFVFIIGLIAFIGIVGTPGRYLGG